MTMCTGGSGSPSQSAAARKFVGVTLAVAAKNVGNPEQADRLRSRAAGLLGASPSSTGKNVTGV